MSNGTVGLVVFAAAFAATYLLRSWQKQAAETKSGHAFFIWIGMVIILAFPIIALVIGMSKRLLVAANFTKDDRRRAAQEFQPWGARLQGFFLIWCGLCVGGLAILTSRR